MTHQAKGGARVLVFLLALAIFIHALDRGNFPTAAPLINDSLALDNTHMGWLLSAFFLTYVPGHVLAGWLVERLNAYRTLSLGLAAWSLATLLMGLAGSFGAMLALRLLLGIGESAGFPAASKLLAQTLPHEKLGTANGLIGAGLMLGNGIGVLLGGMLIARFGWHMLFFVFGGLSLLWLVPWLTLISGPKDQGAAAATVDHAAPSYREMLSRRETWGAMLGMFTSNYPYFIVLSWLPLYLVKQQGYSLTTMAWLGGTVYLLGALVNLIGGPYIDRLIANGGDAAKLRKRVILASSSIAVACMGACATGKPAFAVAGLLGYSLSIGLGPIGTFTAGQTLGGPRAAGKWIGLQNGAGGLSGVIGPALTGVLIDATGDYRVAFLFATLIAASGLYFWGVMIPKVEPLEWSPAKPR
ncbi:MFS transporter [Novosphingobium sp.]|uniref:MFS transporter n=1 Tax=Novosphingobium sp. TaxID=1874826 RepID=UPI0035B0674A